MTIMETPVRTPKAAPVSAVGIVAEYNPLHNGHAYQIKKAKELSGADFCVIAMSGDFVQRGAPAIFDKYTRTEMALLSGADLVVEIPPTFAVSSAEDFAACSVAIFDRMQVVSHLCFGSEHGEIAPLLETAQVLVQEPEEFSAVLKRELKLGRSFPQARIKALEQLPLSASVPGSLLSAPNNILGVEYLKALIRRNSPIIPITLKRLGNGYHDISLSNVAPSASDSSGCYPLETPLGESCFASASAIRNALDTLSNNSSSPNSYADPEQTLKHLVPDSAWKLMMRCCPVFPNDFSAVLSYRLLELLRQNTDLWLFGDVSQDLASRIRRQIMDTSSFEKRVESLKTRQYTYTRISRSLIHLLLNITKEDISARKGHDYVSYLRVLGFKKQASPLLAQLKRAASLPLITKTADAAQILESQSLQEFYNDLFCSHIYESTAGLKEGGQRTNEYTHPLVIL